MSAKGTLETLARHLAIALQPLEAWLENEPEFLFAIQKLGWPVESLPPSYAAIATDVSDLIALADSLGDEPSVEAVLGLIDRTGAVVDTLQHGLSDMPAGVDASFTSEIGKPLVELLLHEYLHAHSPRLFQLLNALGAVRSEFVDAEGHQTAFLSQQIDPGAFVELLTHPEQHLRNVYGFGGVEFDFDFLSTVVTEWALRSGLPITTGLPDPELVAGLQSGLELDGPEVIDRQTGFDFFAFEDALKGRIPVGLRILSLPAEGTELPGVVVVPEIPTEFDAPIQLADDLVLSLRAATTAGEPFGLVLRPSGLEVRYPFDDSATFPSSGFGLSLDYDPAEPALLLGRPGATRLELGGFNTGFNLDTTPSGLDFGVTVEVESLAVVLSLADADGFIGSLVGGIDRRVELSPVVTWSHAGALSLQAAAGFEVEFRPALQLGPVLVEFVRLALEADSGPPAALATIVAVTFSGAIGPATFVVEDMGLAGTLGLEGGNAGLFDLELAFKPPTGLGLAVDAGVVTGGGYLSLDFDKGEYAGAVQLEALGLGLAATGILLTELEDGSGWSLIVTISVTFRGVQLGFGFTLDGVGGLHGIHRSMATEVLQLGLKDGTLDAVLYPDDPVGDAPLILSTLGSAFPPAVDQYVFGPTLKIGWAGMLSAEVGVLFEIPDPIVVALVGQLEVGLPFLGSPLVELHMDTLGVLDLAGGELSIDASLYDSQVVGFSLTGDIAIRANWLSDPSFILSVGGFHPAYPVPASLPSLDRVGISLDTGGNPLIQLSGYFAVTSNSVQFGAHFDFYMKLVGFSIEAWAGFDVLVLFSPFELRADLGIGATVKAGNITLLGVDLQVTVIGPKPWHVYGSAEFKLVGIKTSFNVDVTLPPHGGPEEIEPVDAGDLVLEAFSNEQNWVATLPEGEPSGVTFIETYGATGLLLHPSGRLEIRQKTAPLGEEIDKVGNAEVLGGNHFSIAAVEVVATDGSTTELPESDWLALNDWLAPGQYFELTEDQKLGGDSFEMMQVGISVGGGGFTAGTELDAVFDYETGIIDPSVEQADGFEALTTIYRFALQDTDQIRLSQTSGKARAIGAAGGSVPVVTLSEPVWAVASRDTLTEVALETTSTSRAGLAAAARRSADAGAIQVVPAHELQTLAA